MTDTPGQKKPATVAAAPRQAGETTQRKLALSPGSSAVWTERMLDPLERGIDGGQWYSLIDKVWNEKHLLMAAWSVLRKDGAAGVDGQGCALLAAHLSQTVGELARLLQAEHYEPRPVKRVWIDKLGSSEKRPLGIPTVRDRVVQTALAYVLEPIFERDFAEHSYGFRPGRSAQQAIARVETLLAQGQVWVVDADLKRLLRQHPARQTPERGAKENRRRKSAAAAGKVSEPRRAGKRPGLAADGARHPARGGHQPALGEHLSGPARPADGRAGPGDDSLCGRLHHPVPQPGRSGRSFG